MTIRVGSIENEGSSGFSLVPNPPVLGLNLFSSTTKTAAEANRDAYFIANPDELIKYDTDGLRLIQIYWTSPAATFEFQSRSNGLWVNSFAQTVGDLALAGRSVTELSDVTNAGSGQIITNEERAKLAGIAENATNNSSDSFLLDRSNHTGTQAISTITDLQTLLDSKQSKVEGLTIHRFIQVSNNANSTITVNNISTTNILPLLATGSFNSSYNNPTGYGSLSLANNWIDVSNINPNSGFTCRVTLTNNGSGTVTNAVLVMRLITDKTIPSVFTDIINVPESFSTQAAFITMAFSGGIDAIQIGIRTSQSENIRLNGVYLTIQEPISI